MIDRVLLAPKAQAQLFKLEQYISNVNSWWLTDFTNFKLVRVGEGKSEPQSSQLSLEPTQRS